MNNKNKISAFTLTEILVVLVISAIVVGLAFSVLDLVQNNLRAIKNNYAAATEVQHLKQQLKIDFNRYHDIEYNERLQELSLKNAIDSVHYSFLDRIVIRNEDTIPVSISGVEFFFFGNTISEGKADAVKIILGKPSDDFLFVSKINDSKVFFD